MTDRLLCNYDLASNTKTATSSYANNVDNNYDLNEEERIFINFLVSTIDLHNNIIVNTYGENIRLNIDKELESVICNTTCELEDMFTSVNSIAREYVKDCETLVLQNSKRNHNFATININTIKTKYIKVEKTLDITLIELQKLKRRIEKSIVDMEELLIECIELDRKINLYIIAGNEFLRIEGNKYKEIQLSTNNELFDKVMSFQERLNSLTFKKYLLVNQIAQFKIILNNSIVVFNKVEDMIQNVIPKWKLHMARLLGIQFVNDISTNDDMIEELKLLLINNSNENNLNNNNLINALIAASQIIKT